jgi:ATP/maltotriose-dependent transcriptional regulator MalT
LVLYGRDAEREAIRALLEGARASRSGVLVVRGEPGIGKTALLEDARDRATDMHVLTARGVEAESELPFGALHQLIRPALGHVGELPEPQAAALRAALGLSEGGGEERFLVFAACLSLLSELSERRPVLCVIDDAHWFDEASADALRFVARRLDAEGVVMLFGAREGGPRTFDAPDLPSLTLDGLNPEAAAALLNRRIGTEATPFVRERLIEQTRGNALALVELPSALSEEQLAGVAPLPEVLPVPRELERVFLDRARTLPSATQRLLLVAAADDSEDVAVVVRAAAILGLPADALNAAEAGGLVSVRGRQVVFRHPLVRSALYGAATSADRRAAHGALAQVLADDESNVDRRVWHLSASALDDSGDVTLALEAAAERAEARNGNVAAAKALQRAAELKANPAERGRLLVRAAWNLSRAGRDEQAAQRAAEASPLVVDAVQRARLAEVHGLAAIRNGRPLDTVPLLIEAAHDVATIEPRIALELLWLARMIAFQGGDINTHIEITRLAPSIVPPEGDEVSEQLSRALVGFAAMTGGNKDEGVRFLGEVVAWAADTDAAHHVLWGSFAAVWLGEAIRFGELLERAATIARSRGELGLLTDALGLRAAWLSVNHRFDEAAVAASEALELARNLGARNLELQPNTALAIIAAFQGRVDEARDRAEATRALADARGLALRASTATLALALADMAVGRWSEAVDRLDALLEADSAGIDPIVLRTIPDKLEAAIRAGRVEDAHRALDLYDARAAHLRDVTMIPRVAACRALLAEGEEAIAHFEEALRQGGHARPLDLARIQLLYGEHLRRERRRSDARAPLRAALDTFERLGAEPWAERARAELRASGETARKRDPSTLTQLTPQELQVARYVAEGLSNKEVAAKLFLSPRTIDAHLRNVFAKLGLTSRTQLARLELDQAQVREADSLAPA